MSTQQKSTQLMTTRRDEEVAAIRARIAAITERVNQTAAATEFDWRDVGDLYHLVEILDEIMEFWGLEIKS